MPEYGLSLIRIIPYNNGMLDSLLTREHTDQRKAICRHILCSECNWKQKTALIEIYQLIL